MWWTNAAWTSPYSGAERGGHAVAAPLGAGDDRGLARLRLARLDLRLLGPAPAGRRDGRRARSAGRARSGRAARAPSRAGAAGRRRRRRCRRAPCRSGARAPSGAWSPERWSGIHGVQLPPRRRARTCASSVPPRVQRSPIRSKRRGACSTFVVRQPAMCAAPSSSLSSKSEVPAAKALRGRSAPPARAAAPRPMASLRLRRRRCTMVLNTASRRKDRSPRIERDPAVVRRCSRGRCPAGPRRGPRSGSPGALRRPGSAARAVSSSKASRRPQRSQIAW